MQKNTEFSSINRGFSVFSIRIPVTQTIQDVRAARPFITKTHLSLQFFLQVYIGYLGSFLIS